LEIIATVVKVSTQSTAQESGANVKVKELCCFVIGSILLSTFIANAEEAEDKWNLKFQATYVDQKKPAFGAAYSGPNSLMTLSESQHSFTTTVFLGLRPFTGTEIYFNPEMIQGNGLSGLVGLGGPTNGENQKAAASEVTLYNARAFLRQTVNLGGDAIEVKSGPNQVAGQIDSHRLVLTAGKIALVDLFDNNAFSHDPRAQFLNWSIMDYGAFDYAADARGYTDGAALEYFHDDWAFRIGRFMMPRESNGLTLDSDIFHHYGDNFEMEHAHRLAGQPGKLRFLAYRNVARMGGYRDAIAFARANGGTPDLSPVREERVKYGYGASFEQSLTGDIGLFGRWSWNDGASEEYAFTEIDRSLSGGVSIKGASWGRDKDVLGIALARNGISQAHRDYLAAGGLGFFLGDGRLNLYRPEDIIETYYSIAVIKFAWVSLDYQHISNPAYNADRGPAHVGSVRLHLEF
jgi:hypothetical protein